MGTLGRLMTRSALLPGVLAGLLGLAGCATTTDSSASSTTTAGGDTATARPLPAGVAAQLGEIVDLATGLGNEIAEAGSTEDDQLAEVQAIWEVAGPTISETEPALFREFEHQLAILAGGVDKNRPADADKAARNLSVVAEAYLAAHPD